MKDHVTVYELLAREHWAYFEAKEKYGKYFEHAIKGHSLLENFMGSITGEAFFFLSFLSTVKKHHMLQLFSAVRRHHTQCLMNLRQVIESAANATYAIGNPHQDNFAIADKYGILHEPKGLKKKRNKWLDENYPKGSDDLKRMKKAIQYGAHSNLVNSFLGFKPMGKEIETPFFDLKNDFLVKSDLWVTGNIAIGVTNLFYGISQKYPLFKFLDDFTERANALSKESLELKKEMSKTSNFIKTEMIAQDKAK